MEEKQQVEEERAKEELESGRQSAITVNTLLEKLSKPDEKALYYAGGVQLLTDAVQDCESPPHTNSFSDMQPLELSCWNISTWIDLSRWVGTQVLVRRHTVQQKKERVYSRLQDECVLVMAL